MKSTGKFPAVQERPRSPIDQRLLLRAPEVASMLGLSVRAVWRLSSAGVLPPPVKINGATRWKVADLESWVEDLA